MLCCTVATSYGIIYTIYLKASLNQNQASEPTVFQSNIGLILQGVGEFDLALKFLQKALQLNIQ